MFLKDYLTNIDIYKTARRLADDILKSYLDIGFKIDKLPEKREKLIQDNIKAINDLKNILGDSKKSTEQVILFENPVEKGVYYPVIQKNNDIYSVTEMEWENWNHYEITFPPNMSDDIGVFWILRDVFFFGLSQEEHRKRVKEIEESLIKAEEDRKNGKFFSAEEVFKQIKENLK